MKLILIIFFLLQGSTILAQDNPCLDKLLMKEGSWGKTNRTENAPANELLVQKKFVSAVQSQMSSNYSPRHLQAEFSIWHARLNSREPVTTYGLTLYGMQYSCSEGQLKLNHETSTKMMIGFNQFTETQLYDTITDHMLTGFNRLSHGLPVEVQPGVWQFPDDRASLGFGMAGNSKLWLIGYNGKLPWTFVTRREFLMKRRKNLHLQMTEEEPRYKEQLQQMAMMKKEKETQLKNDEARLKNFMNVTYNPMVERVEQNYHKAKTAFEIAINKIEQQLQEGAKELDKPAIVIRSSSNPLDYEFTDKTEPFAEVLVKPNPSYFNKGYGKSVPQLISVEIIYDPNDSIASRFMQDISGALDLQYLRTFIGKSTAGSYTGKTTKLSDPSINTRQQNTSAVKSNQQVKTANSQKQMVPQKGNGSGKGIMLSGTISAPTGINISLKNRNGTELNLTTPKTPGLLFTSMPFRFTKSIDEKDSFDVFIQKLPTNLMAAVYLGKGKAAEHGDKLRMAIDYRYDLVTRSSDDKTFSSFFESYSPAIGGFGSEEGRYVVFVTYTKNMEGSDGKFR
ncbi:MAG: hypothetical protein ACXWB9_10455, partial [Flavisolibacter sp.]